MKWNDVIIRRFSNDWRPTLGDFFRFWRIVFLFRSRRLDDDDDDNDDDDDIEMIRVDVRKKKHGKMKQKTL